MPAASPFVFRAHARMSLGGPQLLPDPAALHPATRAKAHLRLLRLVPTTSRIAALLIAGFGLTLATGSAATVVWNGDVPEYEPVWSNDLDWFGKTAPSPGDSLVFGNSLKDNINDFPDNTPFASITFTNDGWTLGGKAINLTLGGGAIVWSQVDPVANPNVIQMPVTFTSAGVINHTAPGGTLIFTAPINNGNSLLTVNDLAGTMVILNGKITGAGGLTKTGGGLLRLGNSANDYAGDTIVSAGILILTASSVLPGGNASGNVAVTATLDLNGTSQAINGLGGTGWVTNSNSSVAELIVCSKDAASTFTFDGHIGGRLNLVKAQSKPVLVLTQPNSYSGTTTIRNGTLRIGTANALPTATTLRMGLTNNTNNVTFDLAGHDQQLGGLVKDGPGECIITNSSSASDSTLIFSNQFVGSTFLGRIMDRPGRKVNVTVAGGTLALNEASDYRGLSLATNADSELIVSTAQNGGGPFVVADGATLGVVVATKGGTLNVSSLVLGNSPAHRGNLDIDLRAFGHPTNAPISAASLSAQGTVTINVAGSKLRAGRIPLIRYAGAIGGAGFAAFTLGSLPLGVTAQLVNNVRDTSVDLEITAFAGSLVWRGESNGVPANSWNIGLTTNWIDDAAGLPSAYSETATTGPLVLFDDTASNSVVNIPAVVKPYWVTVSNAVLNYSLGGVGMIAGKGSLDKEGSAMLTLNGANAYSGDTVVGEGTLKLGADGAIPSGAGNGNANLDGTLDLAGFAITINGLSGSGRVDNSAGNATLTVGDNDQTSTFSGTIQNSHGTLSLTKTGAGTLTLGGTNTYSGATKVLAGTLVTTTAGQPGGPITVSDHATLALALSSAGDTLRTASLILGSSGTGTTTNHFDLGSFGNPVKPVIDATNLAVHGTSVVNLTGSAFTVGHFALIQHEGPIGGSGYSFALGSLPEGLGAYLSNGPTAVELVIANPAIYTWTGKQDANWDIGITTNWVLNTHATTYQDGDTVLFDATSASRNQVNLTTELAPGAIIVTSAGNDYTFRGPGSLTGGGGLIKEGTLSLVLDTPITFTGSTLINAGTLRLGSNSSLSNSSSIMVASNALLDASALNGGLVVGTNKTLGGYGAIMGPVTVSAGAFLTPGPSPGTLTFRDSLTLQGTATLQIQKHGGVVSGNRVAVNKLMAFGGASGLTVVYAGDPLVGGEVFHLFDASSYGGGLYSWSLPPLSTGLNWSLNQLTTDGTISVNRAPVADSLAVVTTPGVPLYLNVAALVSLSSDPDNNRLGLAAVGTPSHGSVTLDSDGTTLIYIPDANYSGPDQFTYTISDDHGGLTMATNSVLVAKPGDTNYNRFSLPVRQGTNLQVRFNGFPGYDYVIQRSTNLVDWVEILTAAAPVNGQLTFQDPIPPSPPPAHAFYRAVAQLSAAEGEAESIIQATGVQGGFIAHVGSGDGQLTLALQRDSSYMVQGLDRDSAQVAAARQYIMSLGAYGSVAVDQWDGAHLPYIDGFVNLAVVEDMGTMTTNEVNRVLAPLGVAYYRQGSSWLKTVKPRPANIAEWTHYEYDATGVCVAQDTVAGPPRRFQWLAGPKFNRHHDVMSSFNAGVSANGRLFHVMDEGSRESILLPGHWSLIARDAFNGTLLWTRPISSRHPSMYALKSGPAQLPHRLVAVSNVVYVTLDYYGPLVALDAATGATLRTYDQTAATQEVYWSDGTLFVLVDPSPKQWPIYDPSFNTLDALKGKDPSTWWEDHPRVLTALNASTGQILWTNTSFIYPTSIAADSTGVVFHNGTNMVKLDRTTGHVLWKSDVPVPVLDPTFTANGLSVIAYKDTVLVTGGPATNAPSQNLNGMIVSLDSTTGHVLAQWPHGKNSHLHSPNDLFVLDDLVWSTAAASTNPVCTGYDRRTGEVKKVIDPHLSITWIHQRCYRTKATTRWFLTSRACLEFIDTQTNLGLIHDWVRGACLYGVMPCNGLVYTTPNDCACQFEAKLTGLCAMAPASTDPNYPKTEPDSYRLQPGPAYHGVITANPSPDDWPVYRHDEIRSGYTTNQLPATLNIKWQATLGGKLSSVTVAEGKLFVASVDTHTVFALDADTGATVWSFTTGGRVDSPPTIYQGRAIFGSADGYVYCLRATDGALIWRFLAAPTDLRLTSYEQLESVWPVSGSVLVLNDKVYCVSGRSMYMDGGCRFLVLNPTNGVKLIERVMDDKIPGTTNSLATLEKDFNGPVALADLLSSDGLHIFMKSQWFSLEGVRTNLAPFSGDVRINASYANQIGEGVHLFTPTGFLDDTWMHRTYWVWGRSWSSGAGGYYIAGKNAPCGQILSIDEANVYGFGRQPRYYQWTLPKENMLFSTSKANSFFMANPYNWTNTLPFFVKAMVVAGDSLFLGGPPDLEDEQQSFSTMNDSQTKTDLANQDAALNGAQGGQLWVVEKATGITKAMYAVNYLPVWDGMAAARQSLYLATRDGRVICYH